MRWTVAIRRGVALWFFVAAAMLWSSSLPAAEGDSLKGASRKIGDAIATVLKLEGTALAPCLFWDDDNGDAFIALDREKNLIRRISYPDFKILREVSAPSGSHWLCRSAEGLVLSKGFDKGPVPVYRKGAGVWLLDADTFDLKLKFDAHGGSAVSAPGLSIAAGGHESSLTIFDLKTGKMTVLDQIEFIKASHGVAPSRPFQEPTISPDGKYLFTRGGSGAVICKFHFEGSKLKFDEVSQPVGPRVGNRIEVSPDSTRICMPGCGWDQPIFSTVSLTKPALKIEMAGSIVGFDPVFGSIYADKGGHELAVFSAEGALKKEYKLERESSGLTQYLVHPDGGRLLVLMDPHPYWIELPSAGPRRARGEKAKPVATVAPAAPIQEPVTFVAKSVWVNAGEKITLTVLERQGARFRARFQIGRTVDREVNGEIKGDKVSWRTEDVKATLGGPGGNDTGRLGTDADGPKIDFTWEAKDGRTGAFTVRLQK